MTRMVAGTDTGSLVNHLYSGMVSGEIKVGVGATILKWTDRAAGTIIAVDDKGFTVQIDHAKRTDSNGMSEAQNYEFTPNPNGVTYRFAKVSRGKTKGAWRENGRKDGYGVLIGHREKYHDFSF